MGNDSKQMLNELRETGTTKLRELSKQNTSCLKELEGLEQQLNVVKTKKTDHIVLVDGNTSVITTLRRETCQDFVDGLIQYLTDKVAEKQMELVEIAAQMGTINRPELEKEILNSTLPQEKDNASEP